MKGLTKIFKSLGIVAVMAALSASQSFAATFIGSRSDFRDETIYFAITTRFYDGDPDNNTYCWDGSQNINDPEWRGDFKGLIQKLDYIKALGFTAVWITPVVENASGLDYHGYHAFNFNKVDPRYESEDCKFQDLINAAHQRGMKIILDIVLNHTGNFGEDYLCPMFVKDYSKNLSNLRASLKLHPQSVLPSDYDFDAQNAYSLRINNMKNEDGVNHDRRNSYHHVANEWNWDEYSRWYGQIAGDCVDLNTENPRVSEYLVKCYGKFIEMGVDGFRIDTSGHISRLTFNKAFIPQFIELAEKHKAKRNNGPFFMFGEVCARDRNVTYRNQQVLSPYFYTWKESKNYAWDTSTTSWDNVVVTDHGRGNHTNIKSQDQQGADYKNESGMATSTNAFLSGNDYHTPDYSKYSGLSVIDFPMHWNFGSTSEAWNIRSGDKYYNDATYNVVYVDSHDYAPDGAPESQRFAKAQSVWASNLDLMFTFRGIPCLYYGSEIEFKKGCTIDQGANLALKNSGRAYYGGYITGDIKVSDFATYSDATGNMAASLSHPLSQHIQRLNKIRAAIPALRKGQYSTDGCSGKIAFKRRYTDASTDSYVLVAIGGAATFSNVLNGTYTDVITGNKITVSNGTLSTGSFSGEANMRVYVLSTSKTPAPGKIGSDGKYLYDTSAVTTTQRPYDGHQEDGDTWTVKDNSSGGSVEEPETPTAPSMKEGEQAVFFENTANWGGTVYCYLWNGGTKYVGDWPGSKATYLGNNIWKYTYTGGAKIADGSGVIFNAGGSQTKDFDFVNGGYYNANGYVKTIEGAGEIPDTPVTPSDPDATWTIAFDNSSSNWSNVYCYVWDEGDGNREYLGAWPGTKMTPGNIDGKGTHVISFKPGKSLISPMVIFNVGSSSNQTGNLTLINNSLYNTSGLINSGSVTVVPIQTENPLSVEFENGIPVITAPSECMTPVYRVDGTVIMIHLMPGRNQVTNLEKGLYIIAGHKIII